MNIVIVGWLYVALMMAVAEANHPNGTLLGAVFTFLLYGVGPVALVAYLMGHGKRRERARREREEDSAAPDAGGETPADPVAPVRKEP